MISMKPLPVLDEAGAAAGTRSEQSWGQSLGNIEDAKLAVGALKTLIDDAVFLDEEAYSSAANISVHQHKIQLQQRKIRDLDNEIAALRAEVESKDAALAQAHARHVESQGQIKQLQHELENNTVVFKMHYQELITRNEEIERLKAVIEGLQQ